MLGLALVVSSLAAAISSVGGHTGCFQREAGKLGIVDAALSDCTIRETPARPERSPASAGGVFVADATGRVLGRNAGLLGDRVMWISDGVLFVGCTRPATDFTLLYLDEECGGQPYAELGKPEDASYSNLAVPVQGTTGTLEAFVFDGNARSIVPRSIWTGSTCARPCTAGPLCSQSFSERQAWPVRSIGPYPAYTPPFSLVEK